MTLLIFIFYYKYLKCKNYFYLVVKTVLYLKYKYINGKSERKMEKRNSQLKH